MGQWRWMALTTVLVAACMARPAVAQDVQEPCKNHYILMTVDGKSATDTKCQDEAPPDEAPAPVSTQPPPDGPPSLRITQIYSSVDGSTQYIELTEFAGRNDQNHVAGLTLTSTAAGVTRTFVFPQDLPSAQTANRSYVLAVSTDRDPMTGLPRLFQFTGCCVGFRDADFAIPERFLPVEGGTLSIAGVDSWTYPPLPTDGSHALYRNGSTKLAIVFGEMFCPASGTLGNQLCASGVAVSAPLVGAVEFRNAVNDHRFLTVNAETIDSIDEGGNPGWARTGMTIDVGADVSTHLSLEYTYIGSPVCAYRIPADDGVVYFYSLSPDECAAAARQPGAVLESTAAFYAQSPDWTTGVCAPLPGFVDGDLELAPVYRLSSPASGFDTRFTTDVTERDALVAAGWKRSGFGPDGTAFCVY